MFAHNAWYVAGWSHELDRGPWTRTLLGDDVVLFRDAQGVAHAVHARCPHRGAHLGAGRLRSGTLECPLHGWRFASDGRCTRIPSQPPDQPIPKEADARRFVLREQQGILWIWPGDAAGTLPRPPWNEFWEPGPRTRRSFVGARRVDAPFTAVVENALDDSHLPFVHGDTLPGSAAVVPRQRIRIDDDGGGFSGEDDPDSPWVAEAAPGQPVAALTRVLLRISGQHAPRAYRYRLQLPGLVQHHTEYDDARHDTVVAHVTPADGDSTWLFSEVVRTGPSNVLAELAQRWLHRRLMREDERALAWLRGTDARSARAA